MKHIVAIILVLAILFTMACSEPSPKITLIWAIPQTMLEGERAKLITVAGAGSDYNPVAIDYSNALASNTSLTNFDDAYSYLNENYSLDSTFTYEYRVISGGGVLMGSDSNIEEFAAPYYAGDFKIGVRAIRKVLFFIYPSEEKYITLSVPTNALPSITSFTATPSTPLAGSTVSLSVTATDPDGDDSALVYSFLLVKGSGVLTSTNTNTATYTASATAEEVMLQVSVTDERNGKSLSHLSFTTQ